MGWFKKVIFQKHGVNTWNTDDPHTHKCSEPNKIQNILHINTEDVGNKTSNKKNEELTIWPPTKKNVSRNQMPRKVKYVLVCQWYPSYKKMKHWQHELPKKSLSKNRVLRKGKYILFCQRYPFYCKWIQLANYLLTIMQLRKTDK